MSINKDTIKKISKLARISVTKEETDRLEKDLNSILKFVEQFKELNTDKIAPIASVSDQPLTMNKDEIKKINEKEEILKKGNDYDSIGDLLKKFSKENSNPDFDEITLVKSFLNHSDYYLRESSAYALFFIWNLTH